MQSRSRRLLAVLALAASLCGASAGLAQSAPSLGAAASFTVLGGSRVTNTGPTRITGNVGVSPGSTVTGLPKGTPSVGEIASSALARDAQKDAAKAYNDLASRPWDVDLTGKNLGGMTLRPGVYCFKSEARLTGTLTLDGDANGVWIFQVVSTLTTDADSSVVTINGGVSSNVFWRVGGSATLGARSAFIGSILALADITLGTAVNMSGRVLSRNGAVTLDTDLLNLCCCCDLITLTPLSLPNGTIDTLYSSQTITAGAGTPPYTFDVFAGPLPPGLMLTAAGVLSGTPTSSGKYVVMVIAVDAHGCSGIRTYTIVICPIITILPVDLPPATGCIPYKETIKANGGTGPYVFSKTSGALPDGLTLSTDGVLSGTPLVCGDFTFTVTVIDKATGCSATRTYTLHVICLPPTIAPPTLPNGTVGAAYNEQIKADGCCKGPWVFSKTSGTLPPGLTLSPDGLLCGTPSMPGVFCFTVTATDPVGGCTGSRMYCIEVTCPTITIVPASLPNGTVGTVYSETITARGSLEPYTFTFTGSLPPGLTLSSDGVLSGIPTKEGPFSITVKATDSYGCFGTQAYNVGFTILPVRRSIFLRWFFPTRILASSTSRPSRPAAEPNPIRSASPRGHSPTA